METLKFSKSEIQSNHTRIKWAEDLIKQLPNTHDGRNSWMLNYGRSEEADKIRERYCESHNMTSKYIEEEQCYEFTNNHENNKE